MTHVTVYKTTGRKQTKYSCVDCGAPVKSRNKSPEWREKKEKLCRRCNGKRNIVKNTKNRLEKSLKIKTKHSSTFFREVSVRQ